MQIGVWLEQSSHQPPEQLEARSGLQVGLQTKLQPLFSAWVKAFGFTFLQLVWAPVSYSRLRAGYSPCLALVSYFAKWGRRTRLYSALWLAVLMWPAVLMTHVHFEGLMEMLVFLTPNVHLLTVAPYTSGMGLHSFPHFSVGAPWAFADSISFDLTWLLASKPRFEPDRLRKPGSLDLCSGLSVTAVGYGVS